jgi:hypothetical protein
MTGVWPPLRSSMASPYLYSTPIVEQTLRQGTPMASGDGQLCETPAAQALLAEAVPGPLPGLVRAPGRQ